MAFSDIHSAKYKDYSVYVPSPPSRLPAVNDPRTLGISPRTGMPHMYHTGSSMEGGRVAPFFRGVERAFKPKNLKKALKTIAPIARVVAPIVAPEASPFIETALTLSGNGMRRGCGVAVLGGQKGIRRM